MRRVIENNLLSTAALLAATLIIVVALLAAKPQAAHSQSTTVAINGYAWSENVGWLSLNCAQGGNNEANVCGTSNYGLTIDGSGNITGYAWSENIGWVSANPSDLAGCPNAPCTATINGSGQLQGWLKALAADNNGWDGWISLSGSNYGVTVNNGLFSGYSWDDVNVGWMDWEYASSTYGTCTPSTVYTCSGNTIVQTTTGASCVVTQTNLATCTAPAFCSNGSSVCLYPQPSGTFTITPSLVSQGATVSVTWNMSNVQSCTVVGTNGDSWSGLTGSYTSQPITQQTTYTLSCKQDDPQAPPYTQTITVGIAPHFQER